MEIFIAAKVSITWNEKNEGLYIINKHLPGTPEVTFVAIQKYEIPIIKMENELETLQNLLPAQMLQK